MGNFKLTEIRGLIAVDGGETVPDLGPPGAHVSDKVVGVDGVAQEVVVGLRV